MIRYLFLLLIFSTKLHAQDSDSLLPYILQLENDTEKVNQLYNTGYALRNKDPQLAYRFAKYCEEFALKSNSQKHLAKSYNLLGVLFYKKGDLKKAMNYHQLALKLREINKDDLGMGFSLTNLGNIYTDLAIIYSDLKLFSKAENCYLQAIEDYNRVNDKKRIADCLMNLGVLKQNQNQYNAAYENYSVAFNIGKQINDYEIESNCLNNLAQIFSDKGDFEKAIAFNEDALKIRDLMEDELGMADSYLSLSEIYLKQKAIEEAAKFLLLAKNISDKNDYFDGKLLVLKFSSQLNVLQNNYKAAYDEINKYCFLKDSLMKSNKEIQNQFNFDENISLVSEKVKSTNGIQNLWLLIILMALLVLIPLTLTRYTR